MSLESEFIDHNMAEQSWLASRQRPVPENEDQRLEALHQSYALFKDQNLSTDLPDTLSFKVDPERWKNITGNLISNALKFTPRNGRISVSLTVKEAKKQLLVLRVQDSGIGMSEEQIRQLYSGETSQHRTGTEGEETSGLGMLFIKKSVELYRGKISVDSTPGKDTCFSIEIPE